VTIRPAAASQVKSTAHSAQTEGPRLAQENGSTPASGAASSAGAEPANADEKLEEVQVNIPEILVKGSRILNVDVKRTEDDEQPYYIFDSQVIGESGATNVEDFLKQRLTMNTTIQSNSQNPASIFGSSSTVNLRGLGANETLILIDGRRLAGITA